VLLTGAGRGFCAGQDLTAVGDAPLGDLLERYNPLIRKLRALPLPVVCAVNGVAAGAGANLALACDIVLAGRSASFVQAFARIGLVPDCGGTWFLPRLIGSGLAAEMALTGDVLDADTALRYGLVNRVVEPDSLLPTATEFAQKIAGKSWRAVEATKQALRASLQVDLATAMSSSYWSVSALHYHPDLSEGINAFLERRPARFNQTVIPEG
jgi:enoyl-CoA hydratase